MTEKQSEKPKPEDVSKPKKETPKAADTPPKAAQPAAVPAKKPKGNVPPGFGGKELSNEERKAEQERLASAGPAPGFGGA